MNISTEYKTSKETQTFHINLEGKQISVNEMVENCKKRMGDDMFLSCKIRLFLYSVYPYQLNMF